MRLVNNLMTVVDSFCKAEPILYAKLLEHVMNVLGGLLGAQPGSGVLSALNRLIEEHGGVKGVVRHLQQRELATFLPQVIDKLTPKGELSN